MNYYYPIPGQQGNLAALVANTNRQLGDYDKGVDEIVTFTVDYSQLVPAVTLTSYSFRVTPGGMPALAISASNISGTSLEFNVSGGISGVQYVLIIDMTLGDGEIRSDVLNVNVLDPNYTGVCGGPAVTTPASSPGTSGDGFTFTNTGPRFFVSAIDPTNAAILDRWYNTSNGLIYDYVTDGSTSWWEEANQGMNASAVTIYKMNPLAPNGATTTFALMTTAGVTPTIGGDNDLFVSIDGVWQEPTTQYTAVGATITFAIAPAIDSYIFILWIT